MLGSGSGGNATLLRDKDTRVLIDVGLSYRDVARRLDQIGTDPATIDAIVITHAHGDHTRGARLFSKRHSVPVYSTTTVRAEWDVQGLADWRVLIPSQLQDVGRLRFYSLVVPHDASQTVAFRIETSAGLVGFATDIGILTDELIQLFQDCCVLAIESNHSVELLRVSPYAASIRARIASANGHLSNEALAEFIRTHLAGTVRCMVLVHLSRVNNVPEIAELTCREALLACGRGDVQVVVTRQDRVSSTVDLESLAMPRRSSSDWAQEGLPFAQLSAEKVSEAER